MQLSQTLSSAIAQFKVLNSPGTNHTTKDFAPAPSSFFQFLYILKINFLQIVLKEEVFRLCCVCLCLLLLLKKDFDGLTDVFPL